MILLDSRRFTVYASILAIVLFAICLKSIWHKNQLNLVWPRFHYWVQINFVGVVEDVSDLIKEITSCIEVQVKASLESNGIDFSSVIGLPDIFLPSNETVTPFSQLMSFYQQLLYYKQNYNLIVRMIFACCKIIETLFTHVGT